MYCFACENFCKRIKNHNMNKDWIGKYEDFQYGDNEQIELYDKIERFVGIKDNVVENRESYQRLLYLQKTDLNHWAQIDYQRMIKELLYKQKSDLLELSVKQKEILKIGGVAEKYLDEENYDKERKSIITILKEMGYL